MLREVPIPAPPAGRIPASVDLLLREADRRIAAYFESGGAQRAPKFVPSDHLAVYDALTAVRRMLPGPPPAFLEWGCGFGVATCLANLAGFNAAGIEVDAELVGHATALAAEIRLPVRFSTGDIFAPETADRATEAAVVFAYPWPLEVGRWTRRFDTLARSGALLLTFEGIDEMHLYRRD